MNSGIFITDDRLKFSQNLAIFLRDKGITVCTSTEPKNEKNKSSITTEVEWNRDSLFSLQALPIHFKNINVSLDTSIIVFDSIDYNNIYKSNLITEIDKTVTSLVSANISLASTLKNYYLKKAQGCLIFVHRDIDSPCGNMNVAAASAAFVRIAEETVDLIRAANLPGVQTLLVKLDGVEDAVYIEWLANQIDLPILTRSPGRWVKAGKQSFFGR